MCFSYYWEKLVCLSYSSVNLLFQDTVLPVTDFLLFVLIYSFSQHYAPVLCFFLFFCGTEFAFCL